MTPKEKAEAADRDGNCIVCGKAEEGRKRGLCEQHYQELRRKSRSVKRADREEYESFLIERGLLLPSRQGQRITESAIGDATEEFLRLRKRSAEILEEANELDPKTKRKPAKRS